MILSLQLQAQITNGTYTEEIDERIKNLNKSTITSNILINRVFSFAKINDFNQGVQIDTSSYTHFTQAWDELYRASYIKNIIKENELDLILESRKYQANVVPIGIINTEFHEFNFGTKLANTNVTFNETTGLFANIAGKNPFIKRQTTIISPLVTRVTGNTIQFKTDHLFRLYKLGKQIKTLQLVTNGSIYNLISNYNFNTSTFSTIYSSSGIKTLRFNITYADNTTKTTYANVYVNMIATTLAKNSTNTSELLPIEADDDLAFKGYELGDQLEKGKNEYRIYYSDASKTIDKPLYIIDGYDPGDTRKIEREDDGHDVSKESILELMSYDHDKDSITPKKDMIKELNLLGYDIIVVNHTRDSIGSYTVNIPLYSLNFTRTIYRDAGSDYIERNAFTFISLMRHIKSIQQGNEEAVVIGPSMGGLISRYALAYMEKKLAETGDNAKWNHNTRLWVSFDSPHQGANIPIGLQKGIEYFADELDNKGGQKFIDDQLSRPATKQMLVNHYTNNSNLPVGAPNFRNRFQNDLDNLGMPQNLRKVALLNGSMSGVLNGISEAQYLQINTRIPIFGSSSPIIQNKFYHNTNKKNGSQNYLTFNAGGFYLNFLFFKIYIIAQSKKYSTPSSKGSYDIAPGGYFNAQSELANEAQGSSFFTIFGWNYWRTLTTTAYVLDPTHSFIPTKSALAYTGSDVLDEVIGNKDRHCTGETPFDNYFAPEQNEPHITLTTENVAWLKAELDVDNTDKPLPIVYDTKMTGNISAVPGQNLTYSVTDIGENTTYDWFFDVDGYTGTNIGGWRIISNNGNKIVAKAGSPGLAVVVCKITSTNMCSSSVKYTYVNVSPSSDGDGDGQSTCNDALRFSSNPMRSNNSLNKVYIDSDPCNGNFALEKTYKPEKTYYNISIHNVYGEIVYSKNKRV
ncbi:hypothetical protein BTO16_12440 [Polaribacter glomeratus]|uniref:DUF676 domain-containing protein n=2 Tax=Polaribacter glomeratus TaxID=102 RepID=A0A2S7WGG2_9FLAO|nr:hypothetical protein BTO16_12440 [Polaribacter glomeratus]